MILKGITIFRMKERVLHLSPSVLHEANDAMQLHCNFKGVNLTPVEYFGPNFTLHLELNLVPTVYSADIFIPFLSILSHKSMLSKESVG